MSLSSNFSLLLIISFYTCISLYFVLFVLTIYIYTPRCSFHFYFRASNNAYTCYSRSFSLVILFQFKSLRSLFVNCFTHHFMSPFVGLLLQIVAFIRFYYISYLYMFYMTFYYYRNASIFVTHSY